MALQIKKATDRAIEDYKISDKIAKFLYLITDNTLNDKTDRDNKNELIRALFKEGFDIHDPSGTKKIGSKVLQQCLWRVMSKIKFLDYTIHATGKDDATEQLTTEGVRTVMDRGDLSQCFRDKCGVFQNACMYGDGFLFFGKGENDENPVRYRVLRNEDVYADNFAFGVRGVRPANKMVVIFQFDKTEVYSLWPELEENGIFGRIPGTYEDNERDMDRESTDILEVAWAWDKTAKEHVIFAGTQAYELECYYDEEYPYVKNGKPYIPVFQFICQPSEDGFWNYGIGDMIYDLAVVTAKLLNMEVGHVEEGVHPVTLINAPQNKVDELVEKMAEANKARKAGKKPFVAMEYDSSGQQGVTAQSLITQNLTNEWQIVWDRLVREISRLGINIDDVDRGAGFTATQIYAEEETQNAFVKQMQEYNASETKELVDCTLDAIKEFVSNKNSTELNLMTRIKLPDNSTIKLDKKVTMGMLSKELKDNNYFVVVNARGGVDKSDLLRMTNLQQQLAITPPGSPEYSELYRRISEIRGLDMELGQQPVPVEPGGAGAEQQAAAQNQIPTQPGTPQAVNPQDLMKIMESQPF